jgi:hypothetical protein
MIDKIFLSSPSGFPPDKGSDKQAKQDNQA